MSLTKVRPLILVIGVALGSSAHNGLSAQAPRPIKLWSAISVSQPVFWPSEVARLQINFGLVNDGDTVVNPEIDFSQLLVSGAKTNALRPMAFGGIGTSDLNALPPGRALSFGYQLGSYFRQQYS